MTVVRRELNNEASLYCPDRDHECGHRRFVAYQPDGVVDAS